MENLYTKLSENNDKKKKLEIEYGSFNNTKKTCKTSLCFYFTYLYRISKYCFINFFDRKFFELLSFFNPSFAPEKEIISPTKRRHKRIPSQSKENENEKMEIKFDEEDRNPYDIKDIAIYMKKDPKIVFKEGGMISFFFFFNYFYLYFILF